MNYKIVNSKIYLCGESPVWSKSSNNLYWTDIDGKSLHILNLLSGKVLDFKMPGRVSCIAPLFSGGFIAAMENKILKLNERFDILKTLNTLQISNLNWRFNDGKTDRTGSFFWVGSIYLPRDRKEAGLWRYSNDGKLKKIMGGLTTSNGLAWSPDGNIMYHSDSWQSTIWKYDYNKITGDITNKNIFFKTNKRQGRPDGACVDMQGYYWSAGFDGGKLLRISPEGQLDREIILPMIRPTMPAFGGKDMKSIFITSFGNRKAYSNKFENDTEAGKVISINVGIVGIEETLFKIKI